MRQNRALKALFLSAFPLLSAGPVIAGNATPAPSPVLAKVVATPFALSQIRREDKTPSVSWAVYTGATTLEVTPCGGAATTVPVKVELTTLTVLNPCGDGYTEGVLRLSNPTAGIAVMGRLSALNENFGELTGLVEGQMLSKPAPGQKCVPTWLKAKFHGMFAQDANGAWTVVNCEAKGILTRPGMGVK